MSNSPSTHRHKILAHRGVWGNGVSPNSFAALQSAWQEGFGIETDLRDYEGQIVISHDIPVGNELSLTELVLELLEHPLHLEQTFAANIKADGLEELLGQVPWNGIQYFTFDMSFPTLYKLFNNQIPISLRLSEFETENLNLVSEFGINRYWLDSFGSDWFLNQQDLPWQNPEAEVFIVSPELHNRDPKKVWEWTKVRLKNGQNVKLCTDLPFEFEEYLNE